jgi:hypothetical protein
MTQVVVCDFESTFNGIVHTICLVPVKFGNEFTVQKGVLICVKDVLKCETINENPDVRKKIAASVIDVAKYNLNIKYLNFHEAVTFMNDFIESHGGMVMSHNLLNDLGFLVDTQNFIGGKRVVKNKLKEYPDTGMYDKRWENFSKMCSMSLINNRANKFNQFYYHFCDTNNIPKTYSGYYSTKLETFTKFIHNDPDYKQTHTAVQDTIDLVNVLKSVYKFDGKNVIDGASYIVKPEWTKPLAL